VKIALQATLSQPGTGRKTTAAKAATCLFPSRLPLPKTLSECFVWQVLRIVATMSLATHFLPDHDALKAQVQYFVTNASLELTAGVLNKIDSFADIMNYGRRVFITHLPNNTTDQIVQSAIDLRRDGMEPIPHLAARSLTGPEQLHDTLARLRHEADVRDVLLVGGSRDRPIGEFESTIDMLGTGLFQHFELRSIGVAGHPGGNNDIPDEKIREALQYKNSFACHNNVHMYIVTQFTLDDAVVLGWLEQIREWGNQLPVNIGFPGPARINTLLRYSRMCGVNRSLRFLRKQGLNLLRANSISTPDGIITALARYYHDTPDCPITRAHFYNFGGIKQTMRFLNAIENGHFEMNRFGTGFRVTG